MSLFFKRGNCEFGGRISLSNCYWIWIFLFLSLFFFWRLNPVSVRFLAANGSYTSLGHSLKSKTCAKVLECLAISTL